VLQLVELDRSVEKFARFAGRRYISSADRTALPVGAEQTPLGKNPSGRGTSRALHTWVIADEGSKPYFIPTATVTVEGGT
jgi:hypothetical protein